MSERPRREEELSKRRAILQNLFCGLVSTESAAEQLASLCLKENDIEKSLLRTWLAIIEDAQETTENHKILSECLVAISRLPPAKDEEGNQLVIYKLRTWDDLPMFSWELREAWDQFGRDQASVTTYLNINKFAAQLAHTPHSIFNGYEHFGIWALWLMREALEYPGTQRILKPLDVSLPAVVAWISGLGPEIVLWDNEFASDQRKGDPGRGGDLWHGKHGFCKERWNLWRQRLIELSSSSELSQELRDLAAHGAAKMDGIEAEASGA